MKSGSLNIRRFLWISLWRIYGIYNNFFLEIKHFKPTTTQTCVSMVVGDLEVLLKYLNGPIVILKTIQDIHDEHVLQDIHTPIS